ncbi:hypothetical protein [Alkalilimnicola ehrlichii]|uniref:hypothetical protein n=1 Tax=Alkalilimnicola ehrlichii TaxID=351052 RepID=UPI003BA38D74
MSSQLSAIAAVLTVELAPDAVAQGYQPPRPLERDRGEELAWALAADLQEILGDLQDYGLVIPAALYDLTEILRPGLPMVDILMELYRGGLQGGAFQPQLMAIGAHQGHWPVEAIAPERTPGAGPMLGLPLVFIGPAETMADLERRLEEHLLEKGRAGLRTRELMESDFQAPAVNLAYATFNDLCAMLRLQLEHHGFAELWTLLQGALFHPERRQVTRLDSGNAFWLDGRRVYTPFYTVAQWQAEHGSGLDGYAAWLRTQRQYMAGLGAHGLEVILCAADPALAGACANKGVARLQEKALPHPDRLREKAVESQEGDLTATARVTLTEQRLPDLGPIAYTAELHGPDGELLQQVHDYPLHPGALQSIQADWQARAQGLGAAFELFRPGRVVTDAQAPGQLRGDRPEAP